MKFPSIKIIYKQLKRFNIQPGEMTPCMAKFWRKQKRAWQQSYIEMTAIEYYNSAYVNYEIRAQDYYRCIVYVCRRKKPLNKNRRK